MATRAKFQVSERSQNSWAWNIRLTPVTGGTVENDSFFKATPSGELTLQGVSAEVAYGLTPGKVFYVTLTEAD